MNPAPTPMLLWCPNGHRHVDAGEFAVKPHHTHACQTCGIVWRSAIEPTVGVQFLPGFKDFKPEYIPFCDMCGHVTVLNGQKFKCLNCGNTMGCS